jgi:hypothetical protein
MNAQHTPGPWAVAGESYNDHEAYVIEAGGRTICWTASSLDDAGIEVITAEDDANADLIAAAPELLIALKQIADWDPSAAPSEPKGLSIIDAIDIARAAIAKAKGESK